MLQLRHVVAPAIGALAIVMMVATDVSAQPGGGRGGRGGFGGGGLTGLLRDSNVAKELELVDDQVEQIQEIGNGIGEKMRERFQELRNLPDDERREAFGSIAEEIQEEIEKELSDVLLPHQMKRLKQIQMQQSLRGGGANGLTRGPLADELGITEEQIEELREKAEEVQEELQEEIRKLQEEAREEILTVLTPAQRRKYKELIGEPFEFSRPTFGQGGPGGGRFGQGGQGGGRGGRGGGRGGNGEL